jgi:hypothetical protein
MLRLGVVLSRKRLLGRCLLTLPRLVALFGVIFVVGSGDALAELPGAAPDGASCGMRLAPKSNRMMNSTISSSVPPTWGSAGIIISVLL